MITVPTARHFQRAVLAIALVVVACKVPTKVERGLRLELTEIWADALPDSFDFGGVTGSPRKLVLWSRSQPFLLLRDSTRRYTELTLANLRPPAAAGISPATGRVTILAAADSKQVVLSGAAEVAWASQSLLDRLDDAQFSRGAWYLGVADSAPWPGSDSFTVYELGPGRPLQLWSFARAKTPSRRFAARAALDVGRNGTLVVSERYTPYTVSFLDDSGRVVGTFQPRPTGAAVPDTIRALWDRMVLMRTLSLGSGYLQTFADPTGLNRILVTYDSTGALVSAAFLDQPIGFVVSFPEERIVLAFRRLNRQELVGYEWRWVPTDSSQSSRRTEQ